MAFGSGEIDQPAFADQIDSFAAGKYVGVDEIADIFLDLRRELFQRFEVDFDIEMAGVTDHRADLS